MTDTDLLVTETRAERARLVALAAEFTAEQWDTPSLCASWRVRDVVAHQTMPFRTNGLGFLWGMARSRFSFDRYADRDARMTADRLPAADLVDLWRRNVDHPWSPPGGGPAGALSHDVIHGLDLTEPLGLPSAPPDRIALVLESAGPRNFDYFGVDLSGVRLEADDTDVSLGSGSTVRVPVREILLVITGRRALAEIVDRGRVQRRGDR